VGDVDSTCAGVGWVHKEVVGEAATKDLAVGCAGHNVSLIILARGQVTRWRGAPHLHSHAGLEVGLPGRRAQLGRLPAEVEVDGVIQDWVVVTGSPVVGLAQTGEIPVPEVLASLCENEEVRT